MTEDSDPEIPEQLVEEQLRFLREGGPEPDLGSLDEDAAGFASQALRVIESLVNASPASPPLASDPVAIRLGLVPAPSGSPLQSTADPGDPVTAALAEIEHRFTVSVAPAATDGTSFERRFECRSIVENVLVVVVPDATSRVAMTAHARGAFALTDDLSAVAYTSATATDSVILTYGDSHEILRPSSGWDLDVRSASGEPLTLAVGRYLERSDPQWERVEKLERSGALTGAEVDAEATVRSMRETLTAANPRLDHKKDARSFVLGLSDALFVDWAQRVQSTEHPSDEILDEIRSAVEESL